MICRPTFFIAAALISASWGVSAQQGGDIDTRVLASTCAACHGTDGRAAEGSTVPGLAGVPKPTLTAQMKGFKDGSRPATIMHQLSKGYTDEQIDRLGDYFASIKP
jgi:cytochrome subunit of sulfide dehydrogenase